jgi:hypothetical protein
MQISRERIRWMLDQESELPTTDAITGETARAARGNDMQIELGFGITIQDVFSLFDITNFEVITFTLKDKADRGGATLIQKTTGTFNFNLTIDQWNGGLDQHAIIRLTAAETRLSLGNSDEKEFYWSVRALTIDGTEVTLGDGILKLYNDGVGGADVVTPPLGSSLIPIGTLYSGAGAYVLNGLTPGLIYSWEKNNNDTDLVNGTQTLTSMSWFQAQGTSVTLHGTASQLITALVRWPALVSRDELTAATTGFLKIINAPGVLSGWISPNGKVLRLDGVGDDMLPITKVIDLTA